MDKSVKDLGEQVKKNDEFRLRAEGLKILVDDFHLRGPRIDARLDLIAAQLKVVNTEPERWRSLMADLVSSYSEIEQQAKKAIAIIGSTSVAVDESSRNMGGLIDGLFRTREDQLRGKDIPF